MVPWWEPSSSASSIWRWWEGTWEIMPSQWPAPIQFNVGVQYWRLSISFSKIVSWPRLQNKSDSRFGTRTVAFTWPLGGDVTSVGPPVDGPSVKKTNSVIPKNAFIGYTHNCPMAKNTRSRTCVVHYLCPQFQGIHYPAGTWVPFPASWPSFTLSQLVRGPLLIAHLTYLLAITHLTREPQLIFPQPHQQQGPWFFHELPPLWFVYFQFRRIIFCAKGRPTTTPSPRKDRRNGQLRAVRPAWCHLGGPSPGCPPSYRPWPCGCGTWRYPRAEAALSSVNKTPRQSSHGTPETSTKTLETLHDSSPIKGYSLHDPSPSSAWKFR